MAFRRHPKPAPYTIHYGVTRAGHIGVGIYRDGRLAGWGVNETAAWAAVAGQHGLGHDEAPSP